MSISSSDDSIKAGNESASACGPSPGADLLPRIIEVEVQSLGTSEGVLRVGLSIRFNIAMDAARVENPANYRLLETIDVGGTPVSRAVVVQLSYDVPSNTGILLWEGRPEFALGGNLTINGTPPMGLAEIGDAIFLVGDDSGIPGTNATVLILENAAGAVLQ